MHMALFGMKTWMVRLGVAALGSVAVSAAVAASADGTLKLSAPSTLINPCNGELVTGLVDVQLVVQTNESNNGTHVVVHRSFHGTYEGNQGNSYRVSSKASDQLDALAGYYDLTFENNVLGQGRAPNFEVVGNLRVYVNANQEPTGYAASATSASCK
jgi:hypothetical protein